MYTFKINIKNLISPVVGGGYIICNPLKSGLKLKKYREDGYYRVVRKKIDGKLIFKKTEYLALKKLLDKNELYVPIQIYYNDELKLTGRLDLLGDWDLNKNMCGLQIQTEDEYSLIFAHIDTEIDLKIANATTAKTNVTSELNIVISDSTLLTSGAMAAQLFGEDADLWVLTNTSVVSGYFIYTWNSSRLHFRGLGYRYTDVDGYCHRALTTTELVRTSFDRFRLLIDVINYALGKIGSAVLANPSNYSPYFSVDTDLRYLMICGKSDVKRYDSSNQASFDFIKISELLKIYKQIANLDWYIDGIEFKLAFPSIFEMADLIAYPKHDFTANNYHVNLQKFAFDNSLKVNKETWSFEETSNIDFRKQSIFYDNYEKISKEYSRPDINCDFETVTLNTGDISDNGIVVVAANYIDGFYYILNQKGIISGRLFVNGKLATTNIISEQMISGERPYVSGTFLDNKIELIVGNNKIVEYSNVPIYDPDLLNFEYCINTELGLVIPDELEIDLSLKSASKFTGKIVPLRVTTKSAHYVSYLTARSGGIIPETSLVITKRGVCWNTSHNPIYSISGIKTTNDGTGDGEYISYLTGLTSYTTYYVRAYIIISGIITYGNEITFRTLKYATSQWNIISVTKSANVATLIMTATSTYEIILKFSVFMNEWRSVTATVPANSTNYPVTMVLTMQHNIAIRDLWKLEYIKDGITTIIGRNDFDPTNDPLQ